MIKLTSIRSRVKEVIDVAKSREGRVVKIRTAVTKKEEEMGIGLNTYSIRGRPRGDKHEILFI